MTSTRFGVWFTDGEMSFGWLAHDGGNGRPYSLIVGTQEEADEIAKFNGDRDPDFVYVGLSRDLADEAFDKVVAEAREKMRMRQRARWR